jgi:hypothetical protein
MRDTMRRAFDGAVLPGGVHGLENEQQRVAVGSVQQFLLRAQILHVRGQHVLVLAAGLVRRAGAGRPLLQVDLASFIDSKIGRLDLHAPLRR